MSTQFAEWVEIAEETGGHLDFSIYDVLHDWRQDRAQRDAERDELLALVENSQYLLVRWRAYLDADDPCGDVGIVIATIKENRAAIARVRGAQ